MNGYTEFPENRTDIDAEDHLEYLRNVLKDFRKIQDALTDFLIERGYDGDVSDTDGRVRYISDKFRAAGIPVPRSVNKWFSGSKAGRKAAFQLCFAFGLNEDETDDFFKKVYLDRSFDCRNLEELMYYYCISNGYGYDKAEELIKAVKDLPVYDSRPDEIMYTAAIRDIVDDFETDEELLDYIRKNLHQFDFKNVTARENIISLWEDISDIAVKEDKKYGAWQWDEALEKESIFKKKGNGKELSAHDVFCYMIGLTEAEVKKLGTDRSIKPVIESLDPVISNSFPESASLRKIIAGEYKMSYETIRKMLILRQIQILRRLIYNQVNGGNDMDKREAMSPGTVLRFDTERNTAVYQVADEIGRGASCIVYNGSYETNAGDRKPVRIKELYPIGMRITRDAAVRKTIKSNK